jgi:hypothetical protein
VLLQDLSLPAEELKQYRNNFLYVTSFQLSQLDLLRAVEKVTNTSEKDWNITRTPVDVVISNGREELMNGNMRGIIDVLYGMQFNPGKGGNIDERTSNEKLRLPSENLEEVIAEVVNKLE